MKLLPTLFTLALAPVLLLACSSSADGEPVQAADGMGAADKEAFARSEGLELRSFDLNRDNLPDVFKFFRVEDDPDNKGGQINKLVRREQDLNHDGRIDFTTVYDAGERLSEEHIDLDYDGRVDESCFYDDGQLVRKEFDLNYDGETDIRKFYASKKIERIEIDRNTDGRVDTWEYYENGVIDRIGTDTTGDGQVDHWDTKQAAPSEAGGDGSENEDEDEDEDEDETPAGTATDEEGSTSGSPAAGGQPNPGENQL